MKIVNPKRKYIFIIHSGITEIISSRIIESLLKKNIYVDQIFIFHPESYIPSLLKDIKKISFAQKKNSEKNSNKNDTKNLKLFIVSCLHSFTRATSSFGRIFFTRFKFPISLRKICFLNSTLEIPDILKESDLSIYTPHVRLHIFHYVLYFAKNYSYHLIEEGFLSFKPKSYIKPFSSLKLEYILADIISASIVKTITIARAVIDFLYLKFTKNSIDIKNLIKYFKLPIFSLSSLQISSSEPSSVNKISINAFSGIKNTTSHYFKKSSTYENSKLSLIDDLVSEEKQYNLLIFSGRPLKNILQDFDSNAFLSYDPFTIIIRPHPRYYNLTIKNFLNILSKELPEKNILLSEKLRRIPAELISRNKSFNIIYAEDQGKSFSSFYLYHK